MVIFGGLEIVAAGVLYHQHQQHKKEKQRQEEEEEEHERRRAERRAARRREKREGRRDEREKRSESEPPPPRRGSKEKYYYAPPPSAIAHPGAGPRPAQHWVPSGPPPPMQYSPQPPNLNPNFPARQTHSASSAVRTDKVAPPQAPPLPGSHPSTSFSNSSFATPSYGQRPPPPPLQTGYNYQPPPPVQHSHSSPTLPTSAYEMQGNDVPPQYLYANVHVPELRTPSPPIGEVRPILRTGGRRSRSNSRVRIALPIEGDESHFVEVTPGESSEMPTSPPPPYRP